MNSKLWVCVKFTTFVDQLVEVELITTLESGPVTASACLGVHGLSFVIMPRIL